MMRESSGLSEDEEFGIDDLELVSDSFGGAADSPSVKYDEEEDAMIQPIGGEFTDTTPQPSADVSDELLGIQEDDLDIDDLDGLADDLDIDDLDGLADDLDEEEIL